ncbi:hypothetical protein ACFWY9_40595 [Amycolatopsis sp. NPDC059027]|uniref:hypothetical protein n=1 Tax=Amycolatopsis sp. NPDC059027 TaxID=3346709 RepID=UPI00366AD783
MSTRNTKLRRVATVMIAGGAAALSVTTLAGCALSEAVTEASNGHVKSVDYATGAAGKADANVKLPDWVPDTAKSVTEVIRTTGSERLLRFTLDDPASLSTCAPGKPDAKPATLTADWWPSGQEGRTDRVCATAWHVLVQGNTVYAYAPETIPQNPKN